MKLFAKLMWMLSLCLVVFGLVSCGNPDDSGDGNRPAVVDEDVIFSPYVNTSIILGEGVKEADVKDISIAYYKRIGKEIPIKNATSDTETHEIIIGKNDRELSRKAYRYLVALENDAGYVGYVICSDGKSAAIAYNEKSFGENVAFNVAVDFFVDKYMGRSSLKFNPGIVHYESFDPITKQDERDNELITRIWNLKLDQMMTKMESDDEATRIIEELKKFRQIFAADNNLVAWLANLYDPAIGGFYYSNSARNNDTYLPDLESTHQAIGLVESILTGYDGTLIDYFGEEIADNFVSFVNNMQAEDNGYFYHPQWPREAINKNQIRKTRDLYDAVGILKTFGASPKYDTPNGIKGSETVTPVSGLTAPLNKSVVKAVSYVVSVNETSNDNYYIPPYLRSASEFTTYLTGIGITTNTSEACDKILSEISQYKAVDNYMASKGEEPIIIDALKRFLSRFQSANGVWSTNDNVYEAYSTLSDVVRVYNALEEPIPGILDIFRTATKIFSYSDEVTKITEISETWAALAAVIDNHFTYTKGDEAIQTLKWRLADFYLSMPVAIASTREALGKFMRDDGTFSSTPDGDANTVYDMPLSMPLIVEGDMNGVFNAAKTLWLSMFSVLDMASVPIFTTADRMFFQKTLLELGIVIKNEIKPAEPIDFEKYNIGDTSDVGAELICADSYVRVEKDPDPEREGQSLHIFSSGNKGNSQEYFNFGITSMQNNASCYVAQFDMMVNPASSKQMFGQVRLGREVCLFGVVNRDGEVLFMQKTQQGFSDSHMHDTGLRAKIGEWFNVRIEFYPGTRENVRIKVFLNGVCISVSDIFWGAYKESNAPSKTYNTLTFQAYPGYTADMYVDNIITESTYKAYSPEKEVFGMNVDSPDVPQVKHEFETGTLPEGMVVGGGSANATLKSDPTNEEGETNTVLAINQNAGKIDLPLIQRGANITAGLVEFDLIVDPSAKSGATYQINFDEFGYNYTYAKRTFGAMQIIVKEESGTKYAVVAETVNGKTGTVFDAVKLELGKKYKMSFYLFFKQAIIAAAVDGEMVGMSTNVHAVTKSGYMGEVNITSITNSVTSIIYIDNLVAERSYIDFEEATAPKIDRVTGTFDDNGNMIFDGVSPEGGELSFDKVTSGTASVKIPVNTRVNVPTMALVGLDVTNASSGTIVIKLEGENGVVISAFALTYKEGGVEIHEYTQNGKYPTSIHRIDSKFFNIVIEYSEVNEAFNILVDGEYVAASNLTYSKGSCKNDFKYVSVSNDGYASFAIDNLYAEEITSVFQAHEVTLENADNLNKVIDYETSSFASMPTKVSITNGDVSAYHRIVEDKIDGKVSKVLVRYTSNENVAGYTSFTKTDLNSGSNAVYFETDIKLESIDENLHFMFALQSNSSVHSEMDIIAPAEKGGALRLTGGGVNKTLDVHEGEWFKLRTEYMSAGDDFDYDGKGDYIYRVYINNDLVCEYKKTSSNATSAVKSIRTRNSASSTGYVYFDNSALGDFTMIYDKPIPPDTDTITYTPGVITNKTVFSASKNTSTVKISEMTVESQVNKVLEMYTSAGSKDTLTITPTLENAEATGVTFETDIMITPESDTAELYLEPFTASGKQAFKLIVKAVKNGDVTVSIDGINETVIGKSGEWIHIKVDYMNPLVDYDGDRKLDILYKVYKGSGEDSVLAATYYKPYGITSYYEPLELTQYKMTMPAESVAKIVLDNTRFWQTVLTPDKAPEFDYSESGELGGGYTGDKFDGNGWS